MRLIEQLRWWAAECDRANSGCQARKLLLEAAEVLEKAESVKHSNPLTIDELRTMHGKPVWIEQENTWGIVGVDEGGLWKDIPFVVFFFKNVRCEYHIEERGLTCYHHEPVKHGRWVERPTGRYGQWQSWCTACGKHSGIGGIESNRHKPYCPNCGAKMDGGADHE